MYDPAAGTGGMLMGAMHRIRDLNPKANVQVYGQELNDDVGDPQLDLMMQDIDPAPDAQRQEPHPGTPSGPTSSI